ncbi:MAG: hypothetical protein ABI611_11385 [Solirubrobacteraceae bacterium]
MIPPGFGVISVVSTDRARLASSVSGVAFTIAAAVACTANVLAPFERGWWLTAYLFLVGGLAQLLLSWGQDALASGPREPPPALLWAQWGFWNAGTAMVAVADMAQVMAVVDVGSIALLVALLLYLRGARPAVRGSDRCASAALEYGYATLLLLLGSSVLLGTFLAGALPGR